MSRRARKIRSLDGLRAVSIGLVLLDHWFGTSRLPQLDLHHWLGDYGNLGVTTFFIISGFLITTLLLDEIEFAGSISLKLFYERRAVRILPPFLALMAVIIVLDNLGWISLHRYDLIYAFTYTVNYSPTHSWSIGHLWSLSVEEQFYLLWPFALKGLGVRRATGLAIGCFLAAPVVRGVQRVFLRQTVLADLRIFPAVADGLAIGCLLAILRPWLLEKSWYLKLTRGPLVFLYVLLIFAINRMRGYTAVTVLGEPFMLLAIAILIEWSIRDDRGAVGRVLNSAGFVFVGTLSYSIYLWQQLFLNENSDAWPCRFPVNLFLACGVAAMSYFLLERPLLKLRARLGARARPVETSP